MNTIKLNLKEKSYPIYIQKGIILKAGNILKKLRIGKDAIVITNNYLFNKFGNIIKNSLNKNNLSCKFYTVPDSEKTKSIKYCLGIIEKISGYDNKRQIFIIALGGGVIGDLSGFIASIYKRGVPYINIPTTLLAQVDSSIGGKTAIDLKIAKNLVGTFYQPNAVIIDPGLLKTLPKKQIKSGLAEVIKYAIIKDSTLFYFLKDNYKKILSIDKESMEFIEKRCINIKAKIVEKDEKEKKGLRTILNFGHTIGHAIESASGYNIYSHGQAISIGMLCASDIALAMGLLKEKTWREIVDLIKLYQISDKKKTRVSLGRIMDSLMRDKKFINVKNKFVLPISIGKVIVKQNISEKLIKKTISSRIPISSLV